MNLKKAFLDLYSDYHIDDFIGAPALLANYFIRGPLNTEFNI